MGQPLVWEAGVLAAAANWGCGCRLPGSSVPGVTSGSDPVDLLWPPEGSPCQEALSSLRLVLGKGGGGPGSRGGVGEE